MFYKTRVVDCDFSEICLFCKRELPSITCHDHMINCPGRDLQFWPPINNANFDCPFHPRSLVRVV